MLRPNLEELLFGMEKIYMDVGFQTRSTFKMTRGKYNKNPREQWIVFFKQQSMQVAMIMGALEEAYKKIEILVSPSQGAFSLLHKP